MSGRKGKHKRGKVRIHLYVEPKVKAVAVYTAGLRNMSLTDLILDGVRGIAIGAGVMNSDGEICKKHAVQVAAVEKIIKESEVGDGTL